jgi:predicted Zn-dependent protease
MAAGSQPQFDVRQALSRAAACAKQGDLEAAMAHLKELLAAEPDNELGNGMLAGIYAQLNMPERATTCFEKVLTVNPRNVLARFQLGLLQLNSGKPGEAVATFRPNLADDREFLAHFYSAVALLELQEVDQARVLLEHVERHMPRNHNLYPQLQNLLQPLKGGH